MGLFKPNVTIVRHEPQDVSVTTTIHEHRAPTDKSVELLKEMEQAARDKIEASINVGGNGFECVVQFERDHMRDQLIAKAIFKLNGRQMRADAAVTGCERRDADGGCGTLIGRLRDAIAQEIAVQMLGPALAASNLPAIYPSKRM